MTSRFLAPFRSSSRTFFDPFSDLHREMNRLFDDFLTVGPSLPSGMALSTVRLDVREGSKEVSVCAELPGVKPRSVDIRLDGNLLTIAGEKASESEETKEDYYLMERSFGRFQRTVQLPYAPDPDRVHADFNNGLLTIHVPKEPTQGRTKHIAIQSAVPMGQAQPMAVGSTAKSAEAAPH